MRIILASDHSFLLNGGYELTGISKEEMNIGYVTTASKGAGHPAFFKGVRIAIKAAGYKLNEIDISGKGAGELWSFFEDKNVIQVEGGNTFYLLKAIRESGFSEFLSKALEAGKTYIGTSAGAYVMCPTIEVAAWNTERERFGVTDFTALNYVPFVLKAHYEDDQEPLVSAKSKKLDYPLRLLRDGEGFVIES